ncbi:MAG: F0F1 ATP synthase subunit B [Rhodobacteraceae bacterium]|nr:F0F1 ATP synthase subunit B [Paracoccaceae bacterium]
MRALLTTAAFALTTTPAFAAKGPFFSLANTDFIVLISFLIFIGVLVYFKVPGMIGGMLSARADGIQAELNEARALREEAQKLLAEYERKQKEIQGHAEKIVAQAKADAEAAAETAKADLENTVTRRIAAAEDQIASAQASVVKEVRDEAARVAISVARDVIAKQLTAASANKLIDESIDTVGAKLH